MTPNAWRNRRAGLSMFESFAEARPVDAVVRPALVSVQMNADAAARISSHVT